MKKPDTQKTLDDYTQYHAEKYAKYLFGQMKAQMEKQINNGIQFDFSFIPEVIESYKYSSYKDWKASDCCGNSCGCETESVIKEFFDDDFDYVTSELVEQIEQAGPMIHERNPDNGKIYKRNAGDYSSKVEVEEVNAHSKALIKKYLSTNGGDFPKWWESLSGEDKLIITREFFD